MSIDSIASSDYCEFPEIPEENYSYSKEELLGCPHDRMVRIFLKYHFVGPEAAIPEFIRQFERHADTEDEMEEDVFDEPEFHIQICPPFCGNQIQCSTTLERRNCRPL